jgi:hypothetical protein
MNRQDGGRPSGGNRRKNVLVSFKTEAHDLRAGSGP